MALYFDKYAQEGNEFVNKLADELGHSEERDRVTLLLRAVLHTLRERISIPESLHLISQLPMFLKAVYVEQWKFSEQPENYKTADEFFGRVEQLQRSFGEREFSWNQSTRELTAIVLSQLGEYITQGQAEHVLSNLPAEIKDFVESALVRHELT